MEETSFDLHWVPIGSLHPNPWNPNTMADEMYAKAKASIIEFGFVDPITCRARASGGYEIIDGEHRWRAADDLLMTAVPIIDLGVISDVVAKQLTIVLNETRGRYDDAKLGELLRDLRSKNSMEALTKVLPFDKGLIERLSSINRIQIPDFPADMGQKFSAEAQKQSKWVERIYRMPKEAAMVIDDAIQKHNEANTPVPDWRVLELLAADYLGE